MGQSKGGGYSQKPTLLPEQLSYLQSLFSPAQANQQQAAAGFSQFLPGGGGGQPIIDAAMKRYQQQTVPSLLNSLGGNTKGNSGLNQALAASASDLNTNLGAQLAQMQLQASSGLGAMGQNQGQLGVGTPGFAYLQNQPPFWQQALLSSIGAIGEASKAIPGLVALSSAKVKENIRHYEKGLDVIKHLDVKMYDYLPIAGGEKDKVGIIAEKIPKEIQTNINGIKAVDLYGLIGILINSVKQLNERIEELEAI